ncbi:hypothetical protein AB3329_01930 [Streptococcus sp. H31]|uniref:hypothetical protein n=1 Tax=Streptococcus huangxiaojuni TaxID=3237239 RepID=UPI0034A40B4C
MLESIKALFLTSESKYREMSDERIESLKIAELDFFANLREDIECLRDLIGIVDTPETIAIVDEKLSKPRYDFILSQNKRIIEENKRMS